ncbi:MAG: hypothetical protein CRN43_22475, partial [Candidatus Nephrothrix sp. EaCA]
AGHNGGRINNSYATGNASGSSGAGSLAGANEQGVYTNCYRNSDAVITKNGQTASPDDASLIGITAKTKTYMQTDPFKGDLNGTAG